MFKQFSEYLNSKNKLQTSGKVKKIADFEGTVDKKPTKESKHKDAGGKGQDGKINPYKGGNDAKNPNKDDKGGFAHKGDSKLKYEPKTDVPAKVGNGGKKSNTWPKTETQNWIDRTKGMSLAEFTKNMRTEAYKGLNECACQDAPHNSIKETVSVCKCNQRYVSSLVREMKRNGMFSKLFSEMVQHPEAYVTLAKLMEKDESYSRKLVTALNEMISPPMGGSEDSNPMNGMLKKKRPMPMGDDMGMDSEDDASQEDEEGAENPDEDFGDEENGEDGEMDMGDEENPDDMDDDGEDGEDMDMGGEDLEGGDMGGSGPSMPHTKKKHGIDHLLGAMKSHPNMHGSMKSAMGGM